jgi:hypothetical protein
LADGIIRLFTKIFFKLTQKKTPSLLNSAFFLFKQPIKKPAISYLFYLIPNISPFGETKLLYSLMIVAMYL